LHSASRLRIRQDILRTRQDRHSTIRLAIIIMAIIIIMDTDMVIMGFMAGHRIRPCRHIRMVLRHTLLCHHIRHYRRTLRYV
jgi:hypothetical protein